MKNVRRFVSVWLGGAVAVAVACGGSTNSNSGNDAGSASGSGSGSGGGSSSSGSGGGSSSGSIGMEAGLPACLMTGCPTGMSCCISQMGVGTCEASCPDGGGASIQCSSADSCSTGEVCCASIQSRSLTCAASCPSGAFQLCDMTHPCGAGESCVSSPIPGFTICGPAQMEGGVSTEAGLPPDSSVPGDAGGDATGD